MALLLDILDYVAFAVGMLGGVLAFTGKYYPETIRSWENLIDTAQEDFHNWGNSFTRNSFFSVLLTFAIPCTVIVLSYYVSKASPIATTLDIPSWLWLLIIAVLFVTYGAMLLFFFSWTIERLNEWTTKPGEEEGEALETLGWVLFYIGVFADLADKGIGFIQYLFDLIS